MSRQLRIGVDTGGTFTDFVLDDGGGNLLTLKRPSTPQDPAAAVLAGVRGILAAYATETPAGHVESEVVHGSTVATNALLEGKGARAGFVTTEGFTDTLWIARQNRPELYELEPVKPPVPLTEEAALGIPERIAYDGQVLKPLTETSIAALVNALRALNLESVAISLLHSYANPTHERRIAERLRVELPELHVTVSHELLPELREYERASTCLANAAVAPPMTQYLQRVSDGLSAKRFRIMASTGGTLPLAMIHQKPAQTILSGPAGGVAGALHAARSAGVGNIISFDMGGTSTDVSLCEGEPTLTTEGQIAGLPLRLPMIDIHTVGAGGGSRAWIDDGGALRVGPESMGADPGPACYGHQQEPLRPTVTDAHVVLGHIPTDQPLGGTLRLDRAAAQQAVAGLGRQIDVEAGQAAQGIVRVVEAAMARAIRRISVERGHDARDFTLLPFGGAGALHAANLAAGLGIPKVLVPTHAGLLSALGMLSAKPLHTFSQGVMQRVEAEPKSQEDPLSLAPIRSALDNLATKGRKALENDGVPAAQQTLLFSADLRYLGQSYELTIPLGVTDPLITFAERHSQLYGYIAKNRPIEVVALRVEASGPALPPELPRLRRRVGPTPNDLSTEIPQYAEGTRVMAQLMARSDLLAGDIISGPAVLTEYSATTLVPSGWAATVNELGQLWLTQDIGGKTL